MTENTPIDTCIDGIPKLHAGFEIKKRRRIMIGIPCVDRLAQNTDEDYMAMMYYFGRRYPEFDFFLGFKRKSEQFRARNNILEGAYQVDADFCLMLDDDNVFAYENKSSVSDSYEFLRKLVAHMDNDPNLGLAGGLYFHRGGQVRPVVLVKDVNHPDKGDYRYLRDDEILGELQTVDVQGGGCMLIRMKALDFCASPWFEPELQYGTDFQICMKMKKAGYKVACDTSIDLGHVANEQRVITKKNRHLAHAESSQTAEDLSMQGRIGKVYEHFRKDVQDYTGLGMTELRKLEQVYAKEYKPTFKTFEDQDDYYRNAGLPYLARTVWYLQPQWDDYVLRLIRQEMPGQGIDFGCGPARVTFELAKAGHRIWFKDLDGQPSYEFLKWRAKKYGLDGTTAMFEGWPEPGSCDYAMFLDSIEHLRDWRGAVARAAECLKPEGVIVTNFIMNHNYENPEHIFMDKRAFKDHMLALGLFPLNAAVWKKQFGPRLSATEETDKATRGQGEKEKELQRA